MARVFPGDVARPSEATVGRGAANAPAGDSARRVAMLEPANSPSASTAGCVALAVRAGGAGITVKSRALAGPGYATSAPSLEYTGAWDPAKRLRSGGLRTCVCASKNR